MFAGRKKRGFGRKKSRRETEPSRIVALKKCCDMLLAGGYFRARIPTLDPFDKVVGGMCWAITASGVGVDIDILFQENLSMGEQLKLSEVLERALIKMGSPHELQAFQIQGLDYDHLFPVLQWLVRKVIETRRLTGDLVRKLAVSQFSKEYAFPDEEQSTGAFNFVDHVNGRYQPQRRFKKGNTMTFDTDLTRVEATLMEYGEKLLSASFIDQEAEDARKARAAKRGKRLGAAQEAEDAKNAEREEARQKAEAMEAKRIADLRGQLEGTSASGKVSGSSVGAIVGLHADQIASLGDDYADALQRAISENAEAPLTGKKGAEQAFLRQLDALERKVAAAKEALLSKRDAFEASETRYEDLKSKVQQQADYKQRIAEETAKLQELEAKSDNRALLSTLKGLVMMNETLKAQEKEFKSSCKKQRAELLEAIQNIEGGDDQDTKRMLEVERIFAKDQTKLQKMRQVLAAKNQEIAQIQRAIDDIPTRAELLQYERRFVELYELVAAKLKETRKYFALYNTLNSSYEYMNQEVKLLKSVIETFPEAMKSTQGKDSFLASLDQIVEGVEKTRAREDMAGETELHNLTLMKDKHNSLLEQQRAYFKAVKEFQEECTNNEKLSVRLEKMQAKVERAQASSP